LARETEPAPAPSAQQSAPAPAPEQSAPAVSSAPTSAHTLVGILELGDRSAALFEVDGVARRIYVGESIGASGWTLAEIKNQEAVIRKGGDVRSVFVGQKF
jgi:Tfp pilus assembly protein PilP